MTGVQTCALPISTKNFLKFISKVVLKSSEEVTKWVSQYKWVELAATAGKIIERGTKLYAYATPLESVFVIVGSPFVADVTPPSLPTGLTATAVSSTQIDLSWNASTDDIGVAGYNIYRNGTFLKSVTTTSTSDTGLSPSTQYCYTVSAYDAAGNVSGQSTQACATTQSGVSVGEITAIPMLTNPSQIAIESGGTTALVIEGRELSRLELSTGAVTTIASGLTSITDIAIESSGKSALLTDYDAGQLLRVDLTNGAVTTIASGFVQPSGVAIEAGGTALVIDQNNNGTLSRINLLTGEVATIASGFDYTPLNGLAIEQEGKSALVVHGTQGWGPIYASLSRVDLTTGAITTISSDVGIPSDVVVEPSGTTALVLGGKIGGDTGVLRVDLSTGTSELLWGSGLAVYGSYILNSIAIEPNGTAVLLTGRQIISSSAVLRLNLSTKVMELVAYGITPEGIALEEGGATVLVTDNSGWVGDALYRVNISSGMTQKIVGLDGPRGITIEEGGATALVVRTGSFGPEYNALNRVDLTTGDVTTITSNLYKPVGIAIESGGSTALVTEDLVSGSLNRVDLSTGVVNQIITGLAYPGGLAIESGGTTALVTQGYSSSGSPVMELSRVDLNTGTISIVASIPSSPRSVTIEPGGTTALVTTDSELYRVDLLTGTVNQITSGLWGGARGVIIESGNTTALVTTPSGIYRVQIK